jgi:hypothetical protein
MSSGLGSGAPLGWKGVCSCCECSLWLNFLHLESISLPRETDYCNPARAATASPSSAVLDLVALPQRARSQPHRLPGHARDLRACASTAPARP